jgi:hypothetical protein
MEDNSPYKEALPIKVSKGRYTAYVSPEDKEFAEQFTWSAVKTTHHVYAIRSLKGNNKVKIQMARDIMSRMIGRELVKGETVRHRNKVGLDCTRDNLILKGFK